MQEILSSWTYRYLLFPILSKSGHKLINKKPCNNLKNEVKRKHCTIKFTTLHQKSVIAHNVEGVYKVVEFKKLETKLTTKANSDL
jgi:hypothetical protein